MIKYRLHKNYHFNKFLSVNSMLVSKYFHIAVRQSPELSLQIKTLCPLNIIFPYLLPLDPGCLHSASPFMKLINLGMLYNIWVLPTYWFIHIVECERFFFHFLAIYHCVMCINHSLFEQSVAGRHLVSSTCLGMTRLEHIGPTLA